jgi:hypothetical protein
MARLQRPFNSHGQNGSNDVRDIELRSRTGMLEPFARGAGILYAARSRQGNLEQRGVVGGDVVENRKEDKCLILGSVVVVRCG